MRVAYLTNQYPKVSHSFIRREIAALEDRGVSVERFTLRTVDEPLVDPSDVRERERTTTLVDGSAAPLARSTTRRSLQNPARFARAFALSLELGRRSERGVLRNAGYLAAAARLADELEARSVTHLHAHFGTNPAAVALLCHELTGIPYSFTVHGPEEFDQTFSLGLARKIERAAFVAGVSSYGVSQLRRLCDPASWEKLVVVRCGLDASYLELPPTPVPDTTTLVSVARLSAQKGQVTLLRALARVASSGRDVRLVLVGDGELRASIEAEARALGVADRLVITGWASGDEVQRHLREARAFVLPSYAEGLPVVMMEALAMGRPVLSTYVAGIPELVTPGVDGWLVPAGAVDELADAMCTCLATPTAELTRLGLEGRARVLAMHDARASAATLHARFEAAQRQR